MIYDSAAIGVGEDVMVTKRRTLEVWDKERGLVDVKPVMKLGRGYVLCIPTIWVNLFCDLNDIRVSIEMLEEEPGFIIRPFRGPLPVQQETLPLPGF